MGRHQLPAHRGHGGLKQSMTKQAWRGEHPAEQGRPQGDKVVCPLIARRNKNILLNSM